MMASKTPILDAAILAAAAADHQLPDDWEPVEADRRYAQSLIGEILEGLEEIPQLLTPDAGKGYNAALVEIRRRAGLEEALANG